jgi:hypothetical protein
MHEGCGWLNRGRRLKPYRRRVLFSQYHTSSVDYENRMLYFNLELVRLDAPKRRHTCCTGLCMEMVLVRAGHKVIVSNTNSLVYGIYWRVVISETCLGRQCELHLLPCRRHSIRLSNTQQAVLPVNRRWLHVFHNCVLKTVNGTTEALGPSWTKRRVCWRSRNIPSRKRRVGLDCRAQENAKSDYPSRDASELFSPVLADMR